MRIRSAGLVIAGVLGGIAFIMSCSGPGNMISQLMDMARASDDAGNTGTCGTCTVSGSIDVNPVTIAGASVPLNVRTADTDASRLVSGFVPTSASNTVVVTGPVVITDVRPDSNGSAVFQIGTGATCPPSAPHYFTVNTAASTGAVNTIHGGRILVPAGSVLCVSSSTNGEVLWAGFKPY